MSYAFARAFDFVSRRAVPGNPAFLAALAFALDPRRPDRTGLLAQSAYVCSFCSTQDESAHWLHYGRGGTGCALAFESEALANIPGVLLIPVIYDVAEQERLLRDFVRSLCETLETLVRRHPRDELELQHHAARFAVIGMALLAAFLKGPGFRNEGELRLLVHDSPIGEAIRSPQPREVCFRCINNRLVPYKVVQIDSVALQLITLGASAPLGPDDPGLAVLLQMAIPDRVLCVVKSGIPVRP